MNVTDGSLSFAATIDYSQLEAAVKNIESRLSSIENVANSAGEAIDNMGGGLEKILAAVGGAAVLKQFATQMFNVRKSFQDTQSVMEVFLGSSEKAEEHLKELQSYAWYNMFDFETLTKASAQLQAFGTDVGDVIPLVDRLSNIAAGTKTNLMDLVAAFNRAKSVGYADSDLLRSFATKGLDVVNTLRDMGMAVSNTSVTFEQLMIAVESATNEGGRFYNLMDSQFDNLSSLAGAVEDDISIMFNEIGEKLQPAMESILKATHSLIDNYETIGRVLAVLLTTYGAYRTALITTTVIQNLQAAGIAKLTVWERAHYGLLLLQEKAQALLNKTMLKNPYVLLATVIVGAVASLIAYTKATKDERTEEEKLNDKLEERLKLHNELKDEAEGYIETLINETENVNAFNEAYEKLSELEPFKNMSVEELRGKTTDELKGMLDDWDAAIQEQAINETLNEALNAWYAGFDALKAPLTSVGSLSKKAAYNTAQEGLPEIYAANKKYTEQQIADIQKLDNAQKKLKYEELIKNLQDMNSSLEESDETAKYYGMTMSKNAPLIEMNNQAIALLSQNLQDLIVSEEANTMPIFDPNDDRSVVSQIIAAEEELKNLRAEMILTGNYTPEMISKINAAEKKVQSGRSLYKTLTGREYGKSDNTSTQHLRAAQDAELALIKDSYQRQRKEAQYEAERKIEDLKKTLKEETNLTAEARSAINKEITALRSKMLKDLEDIDRAHIAQAIKTKQELEDIDREQINSEAKWRYELDEAKISLMRDGFAKELAEMQLEHVKRMDEIEQQRKEEEKEYEEIAKKRYLLENPDNNENDFYAQWEGIPKEEQDKIDKRAEERMQNQVSINTKQNADMLHKMLSDYGDYTSQKEDIDSKYIQELEFLNKKMLNSQNEEQKQQINETIGALKEEWAKADFDLDMSQIDATAYKTVADRMKDINAAYDKYLDSLDKAGASEAEMLAVEQERAELTGTIASLNAEIEQRQNELLVTDDPERIKQLNEEIGRLQKELEKVNNLKNTKSFKQQIFDYWDENKKELIVGGINEISGALRELGEATGDASLSDTAQGLDSLAKGLQGFSQGGFVGLLIAGIEDTVGQIEELVLSSAKIKNAIKAAKLDKWKNDMEAIMDDDSIFGEDKVAKINNSLTVMDEAVKKMKELTGQDFGGFNPMDVLNMTNALNWQNYAKVFDPSFVEADVKAYTDALSKGYNEIEAHVLKTQDKGWLFNFFGVDDEFSNLRDMVEGLGYDLYDEYGNLNSEALQAILDTYEDLSEEDRKWMEEAIAYSDEYKEAMENIASYLEDLFGEVAGNIADKMVEAFIATGDAAVDLGEVVSDVGKNMAKDLVKSLIISTYFEGMEDDFKNMIAKNGMTADTAGYIIGRMNEAMVQLGNDTAYWNNVMANLSGLWEGYEGVGESVGTALSSASQESIDMMSGQLNAMRTVQSRIDGKIDSILLELQGFHRDANSRLDANNDKLDQIISNTSEQGSLVRGIGAYL